MFTAYKKFWTNYVNFTGRTNRADYWWTVLCNALIVLPFMSAITSIYYLNYYEYIGKVYNGDIGDIESLVVDTTPNLFTVDIIILSILVLLFYLAILVPNLAISVRRLRDAGFHWSLIFVPIGAILFSFLLLVPFLRAIVFVLVGFAEIFYTILLCQPTKPYQAPVQPAQPMQAPNPYQGQAPQQPAAQPTAPVQSQTPTNQQAAPVQPQTPTNQQ
ncbi:DUF805 domain-containing protein [Streptococcus caviae]|uniref:DUF805 domain-containing protein n=1 Tax=Streptococcus sp. 'caviae' TaxID=1915004 RepID=UPI00094B8086|nr:DUF805 domain-containing protein [Streptococcus sp. 'caviae']OLN84097.1 DUF805 domain-containing protein [Streptococcus sp. 'caviae']